MLACVGSGRRLDLNRGNSASRGVEQFPVTGICRCSGVGMEHKTRPRQGIGIGRARIDDVTHIFQRCQGQRTQRIGPIGVKQRRHQLVAKNRLAPMGGVCPGTAVDRNTALGQTRERRKFGGRAAAGKARVGRIAVVYQAQTGPQVADSQRVADFMHQHRLQLGWAESRQVGTVERDAGQGWQLDRAGTDIEQLCLGQGTTGAVDHTDVEADAQVVDETIHGPVGWKVPDDDLLPARGSITHRLLLHRRQARSRQLQIDVEIRTRRSARNDDNHWRRRHHDDRRRHHHHDDWRRRLQDDDDWRRRRRRRDTTSTSPWPGAGRRAGTGSRVRPGVGTPRSVLAPVGAGRRHAMPSGRPDTRTFIGNHRKSVG